MVLAATIRRSPTTRFLYVNPKSHLTYDNYRLRVRAHQKPVGRAHPTRDYDHLPIGTATVLQYSACYQPV